MFSRLMTGALILGVLVVAVNAQTPPAQPAAEGAAEAAPALEAPAPPANPVLVKVGEVEITQADLDGLLGRMQPYQRSSSRGRALSYLTGRVLSEQFVRVKGLAVSEEVYQAKVAEYTTQLQQQIEQMKQAFEKDMAELRGTMALQAYVEKATSDDAVTKLQEEYPQFFDGTKVTVSHVLIKCSLFDSSAVQLAARQKLEDVIKKIGNRDLTFAAAAAEFSDCPSKAKGGDLGTIEFGGPMDRYFTMEAFRTEEGQISDAFRTKDGWHVVLVTKIEAGDRAPKPWKSPRGKEMTPEDLAKGTILALIDNQIMSLALKAVPVVNLAPELAPAPVPAYIPRPPAPTPAPPAK